MHDKTAHDRIPCSLKNSFSSNIFSRIFTSLSLLASANNCRCSLPPAELTWGRQKWSLPSVENTPFVSAMFLAETSGRLLINHSILFLNPENLASILQDPRQASHTAILTQPNCALGIAQNVQDRTKSHRNTFHHFRSTASFLGLLPGTSLHRQWRWSTINSKNGW